MSDKKDLIPLSASRLKTYKNCAWLYYCNYVLKIPKKSNDGARRGTVMHLIFEVLLKPRHRKHYDDLLFFKELKAVPAIDRLVRKSMQREGIKTEEDNKGNNNYKLIEEMILTGLKTDFFCEDGELQGAEVEFDYISEKGYRIVGIIDKIAKYAKNILGIDDYKSSAEQFGGDDLESSIQAQVYSLWALRVKQMKSFVRFIFPRFPENPIQKLEFDKKKLEKFEDELVKTTEELMNFDYEAAKSHYAADDPTPKRGEGFQGPCLCGYATKKGQLKKDGKPYFCCPYRFETDYFVLIDETSDKIIKSAFTREELEKGKRENQYILKKHYKGCEKFVGDII